MLVQWNWLADITDHTSSTCIRWGQTCTANISLSKNVYACIPTDVSCKTRLFSILTDLCKGGHYSSATSQTDMHSDNCPQYWRRCGCSRHFGSYTHQYLNQRHVPTPIDQIKRPFAYNDVMQHTRTPFPTIPGSNSMWTFRWIVWRAS